MNKIVRTNDKNHDTGLRMLELLKILLLKNQSRRNLISDLKGNGTVDRLYTPEAMLKYFNTFDAAGLKVEKNKTKYTIKNGFYRLELTPAEQNMITEIVNNYPKLHDRAAAFHIQNILNQLDKYTGTDFGVKFAKKVKKEQIKNREEMKSGFVCLFEKYMFEKQNVHITYIKNGRIEEVTGSIQEINEEKNRVVLYVREISKNKKIKFFNILKTEQSPQRVIEQKYVNSVVFEVSGRLANAYKFKPSEYAINQEEDTIVISNTEEDRDALMLRLLKYGENCKVLKPTDFREEFIALTDKMLQILENDV